ncbi:MAG: class I SAM-dependent methyltransferase [Pseudomonadota bacterium]
MRQDAVSIDRFYAAPMGAAAARILSGKISDLWGDASGLSVLGLGYPVPMLEPFLTAKRCIAAMPAEQGATRWSAPGRGVSTLLTDDHRLPFGDGLFDRVIVLHGLEETLSAKTMLREIWRIMAPEGRLVLAAANRRGLWARAESTPFGHGRPWTRRQLTKLLAELFQVTASTHAVHMPPIPWPVIFRAADAWERAGEVLSPGFGGVVLVEAVKRQYIQSRGSAAAPALGAIRAHKGAAALPINQAPKSGHGPDSAG